MRSHNLLDDELADGPWVVRADVLVASGLRDRNSRGLSRLDRSDLPGSVAGSDTGTVSTDYVLPSE